MLLNRTASLLKPANKHAVEVRRSPLPPPAASLPVAGPAHSFPARIPDLQPRQIAGVIWSAAKLGLGRGSAALLPAAFSALGPKKPTNFKPQEISNIFWALGKMQADAGVSVAALDFLAQAVSAQVVAFSAQGLANTLWGLGSILANRAAIVEVRPFRLPHAPRRCQCCAGALRSRMLRCSSGG